MKQLIQIENLSKNYRNVWAVKNITLRIEEGIIFGLIGSNGAGKTTTMKILATLEKPTSGRVLVGGYDVTTSGNKVRELIGYMPDFFGVYDYLTVVEYLDFYAACYGFDWSHRRQIIGQLLELVNLSDKKNHSVDHLSRGMKQRLGLARALIHDPTYLILDEPASGLDPRARIEFREILKVLRSMGKTILISSHVLPELEDICDVIGVMNKGELVTVKAMKARKLTPDTERIIEIRVLDKVEEMVAMLNSAEKVHSVKVEEKSVFVKTTMMEREQIDLLASLIKHQIPVLDFRESVANIEDLFLKVTDNQERRNSDDKAME